MVRSDKRSFFEYLRLILSHTGDWLSSGIIGLFFLLVSFTNIIPANISLFLFTSFFFLGLLNSSYKIWRNDKFEIEQMIEKISDISQCKLEIQIKRIKIGPYELLELVNTGTEDFKELEIKIPDRSVNVIDNPQNIVSAHEISPNVLKQGERLIAHIPVAKTKVQVIGKGIASNKKFRLVKEV